MVTLFQGSSYFFAEESVDDRTVNRKKTKRNSTVWTWFKPVLHILIQQVSLSLTDCLIFKSLFQIKLSIVNNDTVPGSKINIQPASRTECDCEFDLHSMLTVCEVVSIFIFGVIATIKSSILPCCSIFVALCQTKRNLINTNTADYSNNIVQSTELTEFKV